MSGPGSLDDVRVSSDIPVEMAVLGSMLGSGAMIDEVAEIIEPRDFARPGHQVIANAIIMMRAAGEPVDALTLRSEMIANGEGKHIDGGEYLHTLLAAVDTPAWAARYARIVKERAEQRRIDEALARGWQRNREGASPAAVIDGIERDLAAVVTGAEGPPPDLMDIGSFCEQVFPRAAPVIPGLLNAQERVIVVAGEGAGKSTLGRQVWVMTAAGLHPFTGTQIPAKRVLMVDLENPPSIVQAKTRPLYELGRAMPGWDDGRARIWARPGGIDVRHAADARQLAAVIKAAAPDLIVAGPLYKMSVDGGERAEQLHSGVAAFWDRVRDRHGCALWLEAHAPMGQSGAPRDMRPLGSGIWQRWPEFGISLRRDPDNRAALKLSRFRGDRDERQWPERLERPAWDEPWRWPWKAVYPPGTFRDRAADGDRTA